MALLRQSCHRGKIWGSPISWERAQLYAEKVSNIGHVIQLRQLKILGAADAAIC